MSGEGLKVERLEKLREKCALEIADLAAIKAMGPDTFFPGAGVVEVYAPELKELLDNYRPTPDAALRLEPSLVISDSKIGLAALEK